MFKVSSTLECPKCLATKVISAPLFIKRDAHECLKSCSLIILTPDLIKLKKDLEQELEDYTIDIDGTSFGK